MGSTDVADAFDATGRGSVAYRGGASYLPRDEAYVDGEDVDFCMALTSRGGCAAGNVGTTRRCFEGNVCPRRCGFSSPVAMERALLTDGSGGPIMSMRARSWLLVGGVVAAASSAAVACGTGDERSSSTDEDALLRGPRAPQVLTQRNDNARSGWNRLERDLTPSTVGSGRFGKIAEWPVTGQVYAQPLYFHDTQANRDLLIVATEDNQVVAFDAQSRAATGTKVWDTLLPPPVEMVRWKPEGVVENVGPHLGVTSTPVIDEAHRIVYVVAAETHTNRLGDYIGFYIHALSIDTGKDVVKPRLISPVAKDSSGRPLKFHPELQGQRPGLLLDHDQIVVSFATNLGDYQLPDAGYKYYGWVLGFDRATLAPTGTFVTTPDDSQGGVWQGGGGPAADARGNVFVMTGNALTDGPPGYGNSLIQLSHGLAVESFFLPQATLHGDQDLGSSNPVVLPGNRYVMGAGKSGLLYVAGINSLGGYMPGDTGIHQTVDLSTVAATTSPTDWTQVFGAPVYWQARGGTRVFVWPGHSHLVSIPWNGARLVDGAATRGPSTHIPLQYGAYLAVSSNGFDDGVVWANVVNDEGTSVLAAFDGYDVSKTLWSSDACAGDEIPEGARMAAPTIAGGRVFLGHYGWDRRPGIARQDRPIAVGGISVWGLRDTSGCADAGSDAGAPDVGADAGEPDASSCFGGHPPPSDWPTVYRDLFRSTAEGGSLGHCSNGGPCHGNGGAPGGLSLVPATSAQTYLAFTSQRTSRGVLVDRSPDAGPPVLGDPARTPLSWFGAGLTHDMPRDHPTVDVCAAAEVRAWLAAGAHDY